MGEKFKELIKKRLYKLYPFCEVIITDKHDIRAIMVELRWFYKGELYKYAEQISKELIVKNGMNCQEFIAKHFVENAIDEIQGIILKED